MTFPFHLRSRIRGVSTLVCVLLASGWVFASVSAESVRLDLESAFARVDRENLALLINREAVEQALQTAVRERSRLFPSIDLEARQTRSRDAIISGFAREIPDLPRRTYSSRFGAMVVAEAPIVDVIRWADWRIAQFNAEIADLNYETVRQEVYELVGSIYFLHLRNIGRMEVIEANLERDRALLELARDQLEAGVAIQIDVTRAEVRLARTERERLQQETVVMQSALELKRLLRINMDDALNLDAIEPMRVRPEPVSRPVMESVLANNVEYRSAMDALDRNRYARRAAGWQRLPSIRAFGEWGYADETAWSGDYEEEWMVGLSVRVPLFEGFRIRANKLEADAGIRAQEWELQRLEERLGAEYRLSLQDLQSRFEQIAIARRAMELSERELELAENRFTEGVADNRDVVEAQANVADAHDGLVEAIYAYNLSRLEYARVRGNVLLVLRDV